MWAEQQRKTYARTGGRYPSDMTEGEWAHLEPLFRRPNPAVVRARPICVRRLTPFSICCAPAVSMALSPPRRLSAAVDRLQHLPQLPEGWHVERDLGTIAHGAA